MHGWLTSAVRSLDPDGAIEGLHRAHFRGPGLLVDQDQVAFAGGAGLEAPGRDARAADDTGVFGAL
jgi:hypothetical protein